VKLHAMEREHAAGARTGLGGLAVGAVIMELLGLAAAPARAAATASHDGSA
jgi:hypothetical protein